MSFLKRRKSSSPNDDALLLDSSVDDKKNGSASSSSTSSRNGNGKRTTLRNRKPLGKLSASSSRSNRKENSNMDQRSGTPSKKLRFRRPSLPISTNRNKDKKRNEATPNPKSIILEASTSSMDLSCEGEKPMDVSEESGLSNKAVIHDEGKDVFLFGSPSDGDNNGNNNLDDQNPLLKLDCAVELERRLQKKNIQIEQKDAQIKQKDEELSALHAKVVEIEGGLRDIEKERMVLTEKVGTLEADKRRLNHQLALQEIEFVTLLQRLNNDDELSEVEGSSQRSEELTRCCVERDSLKDALNNITKEKEAIHHNLSNCESKIELLELEKAKLQTQFRKEITDLTSELDQRKDHVFNLEMKLEHEKAIVAKLSQKASAPSNHDFQTQEPQEEIEALRIELREKESVVNDLRSDLSSFHALAPEAQRSKLADQVQSQEKELGLLANKYEEQLQESKRREAQQNELALGLEIKIQHQVEQLQEQQQLLQEQEQRHEEERNQFEGTLATLKDFAVAEIGKVGDALSEKQTELTTLTAHVEELESSLEEMKMAHAIKLQKTKADLNNAVASLQKERTHVEMKNIFLYAMEQRLVESKSDHQQVMQNELDQATSLRELLQSKNHEIKAKDEEVANLQNALVDAGQKHKCEGTEKDQQHAAEIARLRATLLGYKTVIEEFEAKESQQAQEIRDLQRAACSADKKQNLFLGQGDKIHAQQETKIESLQEELLAKDLEHEREIKLQAKQFTEKLDLHVAELSERKEEISALKAQVSAMDLHEATLKQEHEFALQLHKNALLWHSEVTFSSAAENERTSQEDETTVDSPTTELEQDLESKVIEQSSTIETLKWDLGQMMSKLMHTTTQLEKVKDQAASQVELEVVKAECTRLHEQLFVRDEKILRLEATVLKLELEKHHLSGNIETNDQEIGESVASDVLLTVERELRVAKMQLNDAKRELEIVNIQASCALHDKSDLELVVDSLKGDLGHSQVKVETLANYNTLLQETMARDIRAQQQLHLENVDLKASLDHQRHHFDFQAQDFISRSVEAEQASLTQLNELRLMHESDEAEISSKVKEVRTLKKLLMERDQTISELMYELESAVQDLKQSRERMKEDESKGVTFRFEYIETQKKIEELKESQQKESITSHQSSQELVSPLCATPWDVEFFGGNLSYSSEEDNLLT